MEVCIAVLLLHPSEASLSRSMWERYQHSVTATQWTAAAQEAEQDFQCVLTL